MPDSPCKYKGKTNTRGRHYKKSVNFTFYHISIEERDSIWAKHAIRRWPMVCVSTCVCITFGACMYYFVCVCAFTIFYACMTIFYVSTFVRIILMRVEKGGCAVCTFHFPRMHGCSCVSFFFSVGMIFCLYGYITFYLYKETFFSTSINPSIYLSTHFSTFNLRHKCNRLAPKLHHIPPPFFLLPVLFLLIRIRETTYLSSKSLLEFV